MKERNELQRHRIISKPEMKDETILTDQECDELIKTLEDNVPKNVTKLRDICNKEEDIPTCPFPNNVINKNLEVGQAIVEVNPITGEKKIVSPVTKDDIKTEYNVCIEPEDIKITEDQIKESSKQQAEDFGLNEEEASKFGDILIRFEKGEKIDIDELPLTLKKVVFSLCEKPSKVEANKIVKSLLAQFISEVKRDKEYLDLQNAIKNELNIPEISELYGDHLRDTIEVGFAKKAKEIEEKAKTETDPEQIKKLNKNAKLLRDMSEMYKEVYTLSTLYHEAEEGKAGKRLDKSIKKYMRECDTFNYKYKYSKYKVNDVSLMGLIIHRHIGDDYTVDDVKKFVVLFCNTCMNMQPEIPTDHIFMYYTIRNILSLDTLDPSSEYYINLIDRIKLVLDTIIIRGKEESKNRGKK